ncbi:MULTISPECIES: nucleotidyltransferase substrate binding protein [Pasteurellaceae]|uniref:Nucleotidyltransferase substrate binding protein n=1 Tax=Pasteurella atlantica TaxID=2827233 RepID=A0AAW8CSI8_9PAST|nr:nucleotidyltransferase substrate binding protein [Pasteurella atlantica]MBR0574426.1 nucleotidyltransferase substrate binding protein [Pasteurella atlantica]MDP8040335.1 nucleotidyltransferase substrate binding protein [Pasteurella atlantica]MDP8042481.1 nucleotidyltransferase substrate binding protein [Pasteurella atlantica]MDP8044605.1 nucleotidyltransferase substrate binding protein [Pasteurella atlantica]MDP8046648.1 nucleotidyltransferase substrate binding protein [Pasteurella atlantic
MENLKNTRFKQRLENFEKAFLQLQKAVSRADELDDLSKEGLIQRFEYTFELAWKTLKDYLESEGEITTSPRQVLKQAFKMNLLDNGELWITMLDKRNLMAHTYNEDYFKQVFESIVNQYFEQIEKLYIQLKEFR